MGHLQLSLSKLYRDKYFSVDLLSRGGHVGWCKKIVTAIVVKFVRIGRLA